MSTVVNHENIVIEGFKKQADGCFFARIKLPAGVISSTQVNKVADVAEEFGSGSIHFTIRGNMEIHRLPESCIGHVYRELKSVGLELRGATGPAVRAVSCTSVLTDGFLESQILARKIQLSFTGNPKFEGLPKKFKIGVEGCYQDACHLIQDLCLVYSGETDGEKTYDVWMAGGLGRHPVEAFLYAKHLPEKRVFPLIEAALEIYMAEAGAGVRLKTLVKEKGREAFIRELDLKLKDRKDMPLKVGFDQHLTPPSTEPGRGKLVVPIRFGQLDSASLRIVAEVARQFSGGYLALTSNQNLALFVGSLANEMEAMSHLQEKGLLTDDMMQAINLRACPGTHECQRGLIPTREIGSQILDRLGPNGHGLKIAISGCSNSCIRPQTADLGIVAKGQEPHFDIYQRQGEHLGKVVHRNLSQEDLLNLIQDLG